MEHLAFKKALEGDDVAAVRELLARDPEMKARINDPVGPFDSLAIIHVRSQGMLDVLLEAGADINGRSRWWAGGFGILDSAPPDVAAYAIERGAVVDAHAAARLGMVEKLRELIAADPAVVHARGGDSKTPLHFASTVAVAELLLERGAEIDARDVDHESTAAQWMLRERREVARYLVRRGCRTDILLAAALGDLELVRRHLDQDPECVHVRVSDEFFPKADPRAGGTIYQWTLGWFVSAHDVAKQFGHEKVFRLLMERSPAEVQLIAACWSGDEAAAKSLIAGNPGFVQRLAEAHRRQIAHAARNNNTVAVRVMLAAGLPVDAVGLHGATALHWAAFHGNAEMVGELLRHGAPLEGRDRDHQGTPLDWVMHGSEHGWYCGTGDFGGVVKLLLAAGAKRPERVRGSAAVRAALGEG